jgi:hypothetical protein
MNEVGFCSPMSLNFIKVFKYSLKNDFELPLLNKLLQKNQIKFAEFLINFKIKIKIIENLNCQRF